MSRAVVGEPFSAAGLSEHNARLVTRVLTESEVPHLRYTDPATGRVVVAIPAPSRARAVEGLAGLEDVLARVDDAGEAAPIGRAMAYWDGQQRCLVYRPLRDPGDQLRLETDTACELELWEPDGDHVRAPGVTPWGRWFRGEVFQRAGSGSWPPPAPADVVDFPIDAVYTWVDDTDVEWARQRDEALRAAGHVASNITVVGDSRFRNRDELRYSLRSLEMFAPFVRHVFLVTADQVPPWLETDHARITVVSHRDVFPSAECLPTFNSHAIEAQLHRIDGLSEHYLYMNDDFFFGRRVHPSTFFHANGVARSFYSRAKIPPGRATGLDPGIDAAAKNGRELIQRAFGRRVTQKLQHAPHAQRRSVVRDLVERFSAEVAETSRHTFRDPSDISVPASLVHHYGYLLGHSIPGSIRYDYFVLDWIDRTERRLREILEDRDYDVFCINDAEVDADQQEFTDELVDWFLRSYYPVPASFERG